jgi:hypothetical protein
MWTDLSGASRLTDGAGLGGKSIFGGSRTTIFTGFGISTGAGGSVIGFASGAGAGDALNAAGLGGITTGRTTGDLFGGFINEGENRESRLIVAIRAGG